MEKNQLIEQQMDDFVKLYHSIGKTISFDKQHWHGEKGSLHGLIHDPDYRLIMEPGEMVKTTDNYNRKIILLGTQFGIIAIYPSQVQPSRGVIPTLSYCTTQSLVDATAARFPTPLLMTARLTEREHFPFLKPEQLFRLTGELAQYCEDRYMVVDDGLPKPKPVKKKFRHRAPAKPGANKPAAKPKQQAAKPKSTNLKVDAAAAPQVKPEPKLLPVQEITPEIMASPDAVCCAA